MKKTLKRLSFFFFIFLSANNLFADSFKEQFVKDGGVDAEKYVAMKEYKKALDVFQNKKIKTDIGTNKVEVTDYKNAFLTFEKSAKNENNPVAAYAGLYIMQNFSIRPEPKKVYELVHILNKTQDFCYARILLGDLFLKGTGTKIDKNKAYSLFTSIDKSTCNDWQKNVLENKIRFSKIK